VKKRHLYTDLALEAAETLGLHEADCGIDGVELDVSDCYGSKTTWVRITSKAGAEAMGKPIGNYVTFEDDGLKEPDAEAHEKIIKALAENLVKLRKINSSAPILVVGLGNKDVTPDALGPKVVSKTLVTRHIIDTLKKSDGRLRPVCAITPGVMGITGIETGEIIKGVADRVEPELIIAIDALAARRANRVNATIQMCDTGVNPGAGVGNKRMALNEEYLGAPVLAIGVPTVVDAATLVNDTMDLMLESMKKELPEGSEFFEMLAELEAEDKYCLVKNVLEPYIGTMFVTPKNVDAVIDRLSNIIANSINIALHPGIDASDINRYMY